MYGNVSKEYSEICGIVSSRSFSKIIMLYTYTDGFMQTDTYF